MSEELIRIGDAAHGKEENAHTPPSLYNQLMEEIRELKQDNQFPAAIILGGEKMKQLEEEIGHKTLVLNRSTEEYMQGGAAAKLGATPIYINHRRPNQQTIITRNTLNQIIKEEKQK